MAGFEPALRRSILITSQTESTTVPHRQNEFRNQRRKQLKNYLPIVYHYNRRRFNLILFIIITEVTLFYNKNSLNSYRSTFI